MRARPAWLAAVAGLALGCSRNAPPPAVDGLSPQRAMLSEGYSMLYADAGKIDHVDLVLLVKIESQEFDDLFTAISAFGGELKGDLERIGRDYPGVRIDLKALPEMELRKRFAIGRDRAIQFAPFSGHGRVEYERTMLIALSNAMNHESHLCRVMAAEEPDPGLKKFLLASERQYDALYERAMRLLEREYFRGGVATAQRP